MSVKCVNMVTLSYYTACQMTTLHINPKLNTNKTE